MRYITIWRRKTIVASLMTLKVYIEDAAGELVIDGVPCRKLGVLKNGDQKRFLIENGTYRLYVIADKLSRNYCNDFCTIPEGDEDIFVCGKNAFNPFIGNPFQFDKRNVFLGAQEKESAQNDQDAQTYNSKKEALMKIERTLLITAIVVGLIGATIFTLWPRNITSPEKMFSKLNMTITLTEDFEDIEQLGFAAYYESSDVKVYAIRERFSRYPVLADYSVYKYYSTLVTHNGLKPVVRLSTEDGLSYFEYNTPGEKVNIVNRCVALIYKTEDSFWLIQFEISEVNYARYREQIQKWAQSITFA